jgi:hypothetical protein
VGRRLALAVALIGALVVGPWGQSPAAAFNRVADGGFESAKGDPLVSPGWTGTDSLFGSPLCSPTAADCSQRSGARTGKVWAWFGGADTAGHTASLSQSLVLPVDARALTFWYRQVDGFQSTDATLDVKVDGSTYGTQHLGGSVSSYSQWAIGLGGLADGRVHTISFDFVSPSATTAGIYIDDVSVVGRPDTQLTTAPAGGVAKGLTVPLAFASDNPEATFSCAVDGAAASPCASPVVLTLAPGPHTFSVAAEDADGVDESPATAAFTVYDCTLLDRVVTLKTAKVTRTARRVKGAKHRLRAAVHAGKEPRVGQLRRKVHRLKRKLKRAGRVLQVALDADLPCRA